MFKIAKLKEVNNEIINITYVTQEQCEFKNGKKVSLESFKTKNMTAPTKTTIIIPIIIIIPLFFI